MAHENLDNYTDIRLDHVTAIRTRLKKRQTNSVKIQIKKLSVPMQYITISKMLGFRLVELLFKIFSLIKMILKNLIFLWC